MCHSLIAFIMLLLVGCPGGDEKPLYLVLEEIPDGPDEAGTGVRVTATADGTMFVVVSRTLQRREPNASWTLLRSEGDLYAAFGAANGELLIARPGACEVSTDHGDTWHVEPNDWLGAEQVVFGQLRGESAVLALVPSPSGLVVLESEGGCTGWVERGRAAVQGYGLSFASFVDDTVFVVLVYSDQNGASVVKAYGEHGGRDWYSASTWPTTYVPATETIDGLALRVDVSEGWYTDDLSGSVEWKAIDVPGPARDVFHDRIYVDHQGYVYVGARYRSIHPLTAANEGRSLALRGPGCGQRDSIPHSERDPFESPLTVENRAGIELYLARHDIGGNVIPELTVGPGQAVSVVSRLNSWWELYDARGVCYRLFEHQRDGQSTSVDDL